MANSYIQQHKWFSIMLRGKKGSLWKIYSSSHEKMRVWKTRSELGKEKKGHCSHRAKDNMAHSGAANARRLRDPFPWYMGIHIRIPFYEPWKILYPVNCFLGIIAEGEEWGYKANKRDKVVRKGPEMFAMNSSWGIQVGELNLVHLLALKLQKVWRWIKGMFQYEDYKVGIKTMLTWILERGFKSQRQLKIFWAFSNSNI